MMKSLFQWHKTTIENVLEKPIKYAIIYFQILGVRLSFQQTSSGVFLVIPKEHFLAAVSFLAFTLFLLFPAHTVFAQTVSDGSAELQIEYEDAIETQAYQLRAIQNILTRYDSPMLPEAKAFMQASIVYNLHPYFIPSISGLESQFGKRMIQGTYNPFGWGGGRIVFDSWTDGIMTVGAGLRYRYATNNSVTIQSIARIYAPPSYTWADKVKFFYEAVLCRRTTDQAIRE
ncbi:MAG: hypothetical protein UZ21_OP11001000698 [Microgenomates bacterium OLB22]|nr:MAG: hypothetical protein UZ21_OP11001000698 [Microgenomates bacterium OLB22]